MANIHINFHHTIGKVKPMHAVNNGPVYKFNVGQRITNIDAFCDAGIPYARNHDAAFCSTYGGEHTVDVHNIFPDFDKDPYDPASYDFPMTDEYIRVCEHAGVRTYYRLGSKIEHGVKKYGTLPPKDFHKWAVICEHIIRHYTEGWADGFHYAIEYWEIWNEPDLDLDDSVDKRCWGGTAKEFYELYCIAHKHLKACFPHLKIGGPACVNVNDDAWRNGFFQMLKDNGIYPDFFSWHRYSSSVENIREKVRLAREMLDRYGFYKTENILNEWNYVRGWKGEDWLYSLKTEKGLKGAAFIAAVMETCQYEKLDMLMYYDARPCGMNGMFSTDYVCEKLKGYYPFYMFNQLYRLDSAAEAVSDDSTVYVAAAVSEKEAAVMLTRYSDDKKEETEVVVDLSGFGAEAGSEIEYYLLDEEHDADFAGRAVYYGERFTPSFRMPNYTTYMIKIRKK